MLLPVSASLAHADLLCIETVGAAYSHGAPQSDGWV
jgi:hypothetical protein